MASKAAQKVGKCCLDNWFMLSTILGVIIGFAVGFGLKQVHLGEVAKMWLRVPGDIYIRLLTLTILPMIASSIISVLASLNPQENGKVSGVALGYILSSNLISSLIGLTFAIIIKPGSYMAAEVANPAQRPSGLIPYIFRDLLYNFFPDNIFGIAINVAISDFDKPQTTPNNETTYNLKNIEGTNMIGVLFCSVLFGIGINRVNERGVPFKEFFQSMCEVVMYVMQKLLLTTPVGVCFMVLSSVVSADDIGSKFKAIGMFLLFNVVGTVVHLLFLCLSLLVVKKNPFRLLRHCLQPWFIAFATTSGTIAIPRCFEAADAYGIRKSVSRFVLPLAGTMKSDAAAYFIVGSCLFVAQGMNIDLDPAKLVIIVLLATAYVTALPNIPSASVVAIITILSSIGVGSKDDVSILYTVEFINDRLRSGNIAISHMFCTAFTYHLCGADPEDETEDDSEGKESLQPDELKWGKLSISERDDSDPDLLLTQQI
ncbi:unnamed protein product [Dibothriocephalus latus]|uniref:Amino acid transporter n=1 Tax=Dibothriocephalus latus TaxID=60516 RepID=A0A3P6SII8_DIBLA|nr:unnamed protein product [Dibothriocephalus latus]